MMSCICFFSV